jgi:hypothetical protein
MTKRRNTMKQTLGIVPGIATIVGSLLGIITVTGALAQAPIQSPPAVPSPAPVQVTIPAPAPAPVPAPAAGQTGHAPKIVCDKPEFNFGTADSTQMVEHAYEIRNAGDLTLEVKQVRPTCGCTVAGISTQMVRPGETSIITAKVNLQGRTGHQQKHIIVESNDPQTPTMILSITGDVKQDYALMPERLSPGQIRSDEVREMDVMFINYTAAKTRVLRCDVLSTNLEASVIEVETGKQYRVHVKTVPPMPVGQLDGIVRLSTDNPMRPAFDIPFNAIVMGALVVAPPQIMLSGGIKEPVTRFIVVRPGLVQNFKILKVETPDPAMTTEQTPFGAAGVRIQINNIVGTNQNLNGKAFKIFTDVDAMKEISIPIQVLSIPGM